LGEGVTEISDLVGLSEVADRLGVSKQVIANWRQRQESFPQPIANLKSGPVWQWAEIAAWAGQNNITIRQFGQAVPANESQEARMTHVVALANMKGGVGKSTLTANLAWYCAYVKNLKVLAVDLDPQFNLSQYLMTPSTYEKHIDSGKGTTLNIFEQRTPEAISGIARKKLSATDVIATVHHWQDNSRIDLIPAHLELSFTLRNPHGKEQLLKSFLEKVHSDYDLILIDCPPTESMLTTAAFMASESVLVPVRPEFLSIIGLPLLVRSLESFRDSYENDQIDMLGIVFNGSGTKQEHDRSRDRVNQVAQANGWYVFQHEVPLSDSYTKGSRLGMPIFLTDHARGTVKAGFYSVAEEFVQRVGL
jgi:chromosome partitioning protein